LDSHFKSGDGDVVTIHINWLVWSLLEALLLIACNIGTGTRENMLEVINQTAPGTKFHILAVKHKMIKIRFARRKIC